MLGDQISPTVADSPRLLDNADGVRADQHVPDPAADSVPIDASFRWRSPDVSRLENFADIIFALALALLGTMDLPKTANELASLWRSLTATGFCFAIIFLIWHGHYVFFRRYDLRDTWTVFLNSVLLFVVFAFAYPLKFLMDFLVDLFTLKFSSSAEIEQVMTLGQARWILILYSVGYATVFLIFAALYRHALRDAERMALTPKERVLTKSATVSALVHFFCALLVITSALVLPTNIAPLSGFLYFLIGPSLYVADRREASELRRLTSDEQEATG